MPIRTELSGRSSSVSLLATPAEISAQVDLEREQIRQGLKKLRENTEKLEEKEYASASVYGVASIEQLLPLVVEHLSQC